MATKASAGKASRSRKKAPEIVLQFLIVLAETDPLIWRRIQVPVSYSFWDLHAAIQDAMGWTDTHLHEFEVWNPASGRVEKVGVPDDEGLGEPSLASWELPVLSVVRDSDLPMTYTYDFGDEWRHVIVPEGYAPREAGLPYPRCISGARARPPEDCGGAGGFVEFLEAIENPRHRRHKEYIEWVGGRYDPEEFDPEQVVFTDPAERLEMALEDDL